MTFNINEGKMNLRFKDENYDEEKIITLVKVADSEVSGAQDIEKIPGLFDLISEDQSTNRK